MPSLYERYQEGFYQEVYDELLAMQENIYETAIYEEALLIMKEIMRRVRFNTELIIPRLHKMGYLFLKGGFWDNYSSEERSLVEKEYPIFQPPTLDTPKHIAELEQFTGSLPLSLKCWYEQVGAINLIGLFPSNERVYGPILDPLYVNSVKMALQMVTSLVNLNMWEEDHMLILAPDHYHKYGYSGAGSYNIALPCIAADANFLNEPHHTTFVNYLRVCFRWGGFPGLEFNNRLSQNELGFLTKDLLPF